MKGILFKPDMAKAVREGRKTVTRRIVNPQPPPECGIHYMLGQESWLPEKDQKPLCHEWEAWGGDLYKNKPENHMCGSHTVKSKYRVGETIFVKERWCQGPFLESDATYEVVYDMTNWDDRVRARYAKKNAMFMPEWAARTFLRITAVRVERLQDITEADAKAEGISVLPLQDASDPSAWWQSSPGVHQDRTARGSFIQLWDSINRKTAPWESNFFVWVYQFELVK